MDAFLVWLEATAISTWIREATTVFAFPTILSLHTIGMGFAVGVNVAIDLRILGVGRRITVADLRQFLPVMWAGFWLNLVSGVLLLLGYPTKALTNPVFYLKLALIVAAMLLAQTINRRIFPSHPSPALATGTVRPSDSAGRAGAGVGVAPGTETHAVALPTRLATASLVCWAAAITAGRLLAYTYRHLMAGM